MKYIDAEKLIAEINRLYVENSTKYENGDACKVLDHLEDFITSLQEEQPEVGLENYISNKLRELGADLINHKPYSFNRGLNVGKTNAYRDILDRINARKEK